MKNKQEDLEPPKRKRSIIYDTQDGETIKKLEDEEDPHDEYPYEPDTRIPVFDKHFKIDIGKGMKWDNDKLRWDLLPYDVIEQIVDIMTYGAKKYAPNNWQKVEMWRYKAALMRHYVAWVGGEKNDPESGKSHLAHALCNLVFIAWKEKHGVP